jgi:hypothetical protein
MQARDLVEYGPSADSALHAGLGFGGMWLVIASPLLWFAIRALRATRAPPRT